VDKCAKVAVVKKLRGKPRSISKEFYLNVSKHSRRTRQSRGVFTQSE
jgi:hypothetical protein